MIYIVNCDYNKQIQLPDGVNCSVGCTLKCPKSCPNRTKFCAGGSGEFTADKVSVDKGEECSGNGFIRYSFEEVCSNWRAGALQTYMDFDDNFDVGDVPTADDGGDDDDILVPIRPKRNYSKIVVRKRVYTDDSDLRCNIALSKPLKGAMRTIFLNWETDTVFASRQNTNELNDEFVWLMVELSDRTIYEDEVKEILQNSGYNRSQKFFHLFYDVIYRDDRPDGFYWCDTNSSFEAMTPRFQNKNDFIEFLLDNKSSGAEFYSRRKAEVLSYLGVEDERHLFAEVTCNAARDAKEVVWVDIDNSNRVKKFGSIEEFTRKMQTPTDLPTMKSMVGFLKEYCLTRQGASARTDDIPFEEIHLGFVDNCILEALQIPRGDDGKVIYETFLSLLSEYVKSFGPDFVKIGGVQFSRDNYGKELCKCLDEFCQEALIYSEGSETGEYRKKKGKALLAMNLKERNVLKSFAINNQDAVDKKIALFNEVSSGSLHSMRDYIDRMKNDDVFVQCEQLDRDELVGEWFNSVLPRSNTDIEGEIRRYKNLYNNFKD